MYKIEHQIIRHPSLPAVLASATSAADGGSSGAWTQAQLVAGTATVVAWLNGSNGTNGSWLLQSAAELSTLSRTRGCCEVYASAARGRSFHGVLRQCDADNSTFYRCSMSTAELSGGGLEYGPTVYPAQTGDTVYLLLSREQSVLGTPFAPLTNDTITADIGLLLPDSEYLVRVRSANLNQGGFEVLGSNVASLLTVGRPQRVTSLDVLYMSGDNAVQLVWEESQGGTFCGDVVYRLYRQPWEPYFGSFSGRWAATHDSFLHSAPAAGGILANLSYWNTNLTAEYANGTIAAAVAAAQAAATSSKARFVVCSYCQAHLVALAPASHTLPFIQDSSLGRRQQAEDGTIDSWCPLGNILEVSRPPYHPRVLSAPSSLVSLFSCSAP